MHCAIYICKFGVAVCKVSMFDCGVRWGQSTMGICALCYIYLPVDLPSLV